MGGRQVLILQSFPLLEGSRVNGATHLTPAPESGFIHIRPSAYIPVVGQLCPGQVALVLCHVQCTGARVQMARSREPDDIGASRQTKVKTIR